MQGGIKKSLFAANILLYLRNDTRQSHSCYGMQIGNHTQAFEWYHFQRLSVTCNPNFKVMILFNIKKLENNTRQSYSYNGRLTVSHTWSVEWRYF